MVFSLLFFTIMYCAQLFRLLLETALTPVPNSFLRKMWISQPIWISHLGQCLHRKIICIFCGFNPLSLRCPDSLAQEGEGRVGDVREEGGEGNQGGEGDEGGEGGGKKFCGFNPLSLRCANSLAVGWVSSSKLLWQRWGFNLWSESKWVDDRDLPTLFINYSSWKCFN